MLSLISPAPGLQGGLHSLKVVQTVTRNANLKDKVLTPPPASALAATSTPATSESGTTIAPAPPAGVNPDVLNADGTFPDVAGLQKKFTSTQLFNVNAPRFTLPPSIIHQTYPPQGFGDHNNVLPHIVFEDPHLPWEQEASTKDDVEEVAEATKTKEFDRNGKPRARNMVPWLALWSFTEDEIKLAPKQLKPRSEGGIFPEGKPAMPSKSVPPPSGNAREQDRSTFVVKMTMGEYLGLGADELTDSNGKAVTICGPIRDVHPVTEPIPKDQQVDVVFVPVDLFKKMVCTYNDDGSRDLNKGPDLHRYKYLAHVRNVNTKNMAGAGLDDTGLYSVVHGHRTGPLDLSHPQPIISHLVSLEGIEDHIEFPKLAGKTHVALVSLFSWTYLCLPPDAVNFVDMMRHIGAEVIEGDCWLRAPDECIDAMDPPKPPKSTPPFEQRLANRMRDGFALQRYLLQTGEETVAFFRGPLTPTYVPPITVQWWPYQSNFSTDYQIMDPQLGIMDISYSSAWQLGRTLGVADRVFASALVRLRAILQTTGRRDALKNKADKLNKVSKASALAGVQKSVAVLASMAATGAGSNPSRSDGRFRKTPAQPAVLVPLGTSVTDDIDHTAIRGEHLEAHIVRQAAVLTSAKDNSFRLNSAPNAVVSDKDAVRIPFNDIVPFNEVNLPNSTDWKIVQDWILKKLSLDNIPAHYLIPDPSFLPRETIRFFYIDSNWMDCLIDGALSIGNHLDQQNDVVRQALKHSLNRYFHKSYRPDHSEMDYFPQIPRFGFLLRSLVVKAFPNLEVHAPWAAGDDPAAADGNDGPIREPVLRLERIDKDVLLCLFDRTPGSPHFDPKVQITISQPAHQQCFRLGIQGGVTPSSVEMQFSQLFTTEQRPAEDPNNPGAPFNILNPAATVIWTKDKGASVSALSTAATDAEKKSHATEVTNLTAASVPPAIFDWDARQIVLPAFAASCNKILSAFSPLQKDDTKYFVDPLPTSGVTGTMLTSNISQMMISVPTPKPFDSKQAIRPPDPITNPRRIRIQEDIEDDPSKWITVTPVPSSPDQTPAHSEPATKPEEVHRSLPYYTPYRDTDKAYINMNLNPTIPESEKTELKLEDRALPRKFVPQFIAKLYPVGTPPPGPGTIGMISIYSNKNDPRNVPIDLIVTLTPLPPHGPRTQDTVHKLQLYIVEVDIPLGTKGTDIAETYTGPGGKMLSNPRFNVHTTLWTQPPGKPGQQPQNFVRFTLVPRSTGRLIPLRNIPEMNFVIWQIRPNRAVDARSAATILVREHYRRFDRNSRQPTSTDPLEGYFTHFGDSTPYIGKKVIN